MSAGDGARLLALAALWGASFLFIRVAVLEVPPLGVVEARLALGAAAIAVYALAARRSGAFAALRRPSTAAVGMVTTGLPYLCFAWGETRVASGIAAIVNAAAPLFSALLAQLLPNRPEFERLTARRSAGLLVGFAGVVSLVLVAGLRGEVDLLGLGVLLIAPVLYAVGAFMARSAFADDSPLAPAVSANGMAALILLPLALVAGRPDHGVSVQAALSLVALGVGGTGIAYVLYYRLLASVGATAALSVTFLLPGFALVYGAVFLSEPVRPVAVLALALILAGSALTTGIGTGRVRAQAESAISDQRS